jgi:hypothetical protein
MACDTKISQKNYTTNRPYQQTHRDKQKTPQIMNDQLDSYLVGDYQYFGGIYFHHLQI